MKYNGITVRFTPLSIFWRLITIVCLPLGLLLWFITVRLDRKDGLHVSWWETLCETYSYLFDIIVTGSCGDVP